MSHRNTKFGRKIQVCDVNDKTIAHYSRRGQNWLLLQSEVWRELRCAHLSSYLELGIQRPSKHRVLHEDLSLKTYKVQLTQELQLWHKSNENFDLSRGDCNWPPRSWDLTLASPSFVDTWKSSTQKSSVDSRAQI